MKYYFHSAGVCPTMMSPDYAPNIIDRTQSMLPNSLMAIYTPVGKLTTPKTIQELFYNRATDIIRHAGNKKIAVAWSGGIDSTAILVEFLKLLPNDRLIVLMNDYSIHEYPEFYARYIDGKIEQKLFDLYNDNFMDSFIDECVIVTGALFDQTMGDSLYHALTEDDLRTTKTEFMNSINEYSRGMYSALFNSCPRNLETLKDIYWWQCYTLNYQNEEMIWLLLSEKLKLEYNLFHFCTDSDWNDYAVSTPSEIKWPGYKQKDYKILLKNHIYEFTGDSYYLDTKQKVFSWRRYRTPSQHSKVPIYITTDWARGYRL
jgi:hypothetical protein